MTVTWVDPRPSEELAGDLVALRHEVGAFTMGRDVIRVSGPDAVGYLQGQCSQDVEAIETGSSADALLLSPQGKLDALVRVTRTREDELHLDVDAGFGAAVMARLARFKLRVRVDIEGLPWTAVALRGPGAAAVVSGNTSSGTSFVVPYSWGGVTGVDLVGPQPQIPVGIRPCGEDAWQTLRVETGIPAMGAELDDHTIAAEADLLERCVSFTKGCYTGQELVARLDARGNKVARHLRAVAVDPGSGTGLTLRTGAGVSVAGKVVGKLTSVAWSPDLGTAVALCYLHRSVEPPSAVEVQVEGADGGTAAARALAVPLL